MSKIVEGIAEIIVKVSDAGYPGTMGIKWKQDDQMWGFWIEGDDFSRLAFWWWIACLSVKGSHLATWMFNKRKSSGVLSFVDDRYDTEGSAHLG